MAKADLSSGAAWIEGNIVPISEAKISVTDWGLTRSDITYDVVHVWDGAFFRLDEYLDRFEKSRTALRLEIEQSRDDIKAILHEMVGKSGLRSAYVSMVASRGVPSVPGTRDPRLCDNHFYAWVVPFVWVLKPEVAERGAHILIAGNSTRIPSSSIDPKVKNYHWGDMTSALFEALDAGYDTTILLDQKGNITEGPGFNVFAVVDGTVVTPVSGTLEGITRRTVLEICEELGIPIEVRDIAVDEFLSGQEAFTATTAGGPVSITKINGNEIGDGNPGALTAKIIAEYWDCHKCKSMNEIIDYV